MADGSLLQLVGCTLGLVVLANSTVRRAAFVEFRARYLHLFGDELPSVWFDAETRSLKTEG